MEILRQALHVMPVFHAAPMPLALTFASPEWLGGLLLVGVPVLLHWLYRRPVREEPWAAMDILRRALARRSQRLRLQTLLLLALRMLLIAAAVVAFAQPMASGVIGGPLSRRAVDRILVLDATMSMKSQERGPLLFEKAKELARQIVAAAQPGDTFRIATIAPQASLSTMRQRSSDFIAIAAEIDRLQPTDAFASPQALLKAASDPIDDPTLPPTEIVLISDFQRATWQPPTTRGAAAERPIAVRPEQVLAIPIGDRQVDNLAISDLQFEPQLFRVGQPVSCSVTIENSGRSPERDVSVEVLVGGTVRGVSRTDVDPGGRSVVTLELAFDRAGEHIIEARIGPDALLADNSAFHVARVRAALRVLLVDSGLPADASPRPSDFVKLALAPQVGDNFDRNGDSITVGQIDDIQLAREDLANWDCIFLCSLPRITLDEARRLEQFVARGGGLVVGAGPRMDVENWNSLLFRDDSGPLPAKLIAWEAGSVDAPATLVLAETPHRILDPFVGNPDSGLTTTRVWESLSIDPPANPPLLTMSNGRAAIVERRFGRGLCLFSTLALDGRGNNWTVWPSFLPLIQEMTAYTIASADPRTVTAGQPLEFQSPGGPDVTLVRPDGSTSDRRVAASVNRSLIISDTLEAGVYSLMAPNASAAVVPGDDSHAPALPAVQYAAVNPDRRESVLERLEPEEIRTLLPGVRIAAQEEWRSTRTAETSTTGTERSLARPLLWVVLALLLIETILTWRFHVGVGLLTGLLVTVALWPFGNAMLAMFSGTATAIAIAVTILRSGESGLFRPAKPGQAVRERGALRRGA